MKRGNGMAQLLHRIDLPEGLRKLNTLQLEQLAEEIRAMIIHTVSVHGGHLAPSLGTVELTLALYSSFSFPKDKLIWDVGHQAYTHKILSGRRDSFHTLRQRNGITGFPNRSESEYDAFGVGHASTSLSAASGMAAARDLRKEHHHVIAVIGDGALTGGEAFEALNHAGDMGRDLIVILNDNEMSIDKNVGAMSAYLSQMRIVPQYNRAKRDVENLIRSIPHIGGKMLRTANSIKDGVRSALVPGGFFEELGFQYVGPLDGHNIQQLREVFVRVKEISGPVLLHVHTKKGKGYAPAETAPEKFHGIGKFDELTGTVEPKKDVPSYTSVFGQALSDCAEKDPSLVAITAAMPSGTGLKDFGKKYPKRFFDVGIAEEHAMTFAAGMAAAGLHPVVALYSTFAQRAYDQLLHDVCLQNLPVTLCLDRAGLVGEDGPTHHGAFDFSYLRHMPNMSILAPKDENELRQMFFAAVKHDGPAAIRYPRGAGLGVPVHREPEPLPWGKAEIVKEGRDIALFAVGSMVKTACLAAELLEKEQISAAVLNMRFVKPLDKEALRGYASAAECVVTCEENALAGGFGSAVAEFFADEGIQVPLLRIGLPDSFVEQGTRQELLELCGLTAEAIVEKVKKRICFHRLEK